MRSLPQLAPAIGLSARDLMTMPTLALNDLVIGTIACTTSTQVGMNVIKWVVTGFTGTAATTAEVATAWSAGCAPLYKPMMGPDGLFYGVKVQRYRPIPPSTPDVGIANAGPGTAALPSMPGQVTGMISTFTASAGPAYRGRTYLPFPSATFNDATLNTPTAAYVALANTLRAYLYNSLVVTGSGGTVTLRPVLYHARTNTYSFYTASQVKVAWATQRRRGNYGRPNFIPPF